MTAPSPSFLAEAERLLPLRDVPHYAGGQWLQMLEEYNKYMRSARPAVAAALQAKQDEIVEMDGLIARQRVVVDAAMAWYLTPTLDNKFKLAAAMADFEAQEYRTALTQPAAASSGETK